MLDTTVYRGMTKPLPGPRLIPNRSTAAAVVVDSGVMVFRRKSFQLA